MTVLFVMSCSHNRLAERKEETTIKERRIFLPPEYPKADFFNEILNNRFAEHDYHINYQPILGKKDGTWYQFWGESEILITIKMHPDNNSCDARITSVNMDYFSKKISDCYEMFKIENLEKNLHFNEKVFFEDRGEYWYHDTWRLIRVVDGEYKMKDFFNDEDKKLIKEAKVEILKYFEKRMKEHIFKRLYQNDSEK